MKRTIHKWITVLLFAFALFCFAMAAFADSDLRDFEAECVSDVEFGPGSCIEKPYEISNVLLTIFWFDTEEEMRDYYIEQGFGNPDRLMRAFSASEVYEEKGMCHLDVYLVRPTLVDDYETTSVGHEVLHCVYGPDYHVTW